MKNLIVFLSLFSLLESWNIPIFAYRFSSALFLSLFEWLYYCVLVFHHWFYRFHAFLNSVVNENKYFLNMSVVLFLKPHFSYHHQGRVLIILKIFMYPWIIRCLLSPDMCFHLFNATYCSWYFRILQGTFIHVERTIQHIFIGDLFNTTLMRYH